MFRLFDLFSSSDDGDSDGENHPHQQLRRRRPRMFKPRINFGLPATDNRMRFRLTDAHVNHIVGVLSPIIQHQTDRNFALTPDQQVRLALRYLATGDYYRSVSDAHGVHNSTLSRTLHRVVEAVNAHLYNDLVDWPVDAEQNRGIVEKFMEKAGMPSVFGCVDGTHIDLVNVPHAIEGQFVNRHRNHSINAMVVCGPRLR
jgi:hypothetical protein